MNYLIVHDLLPIRSNMCCFCKNEPESIKHIFFECQHLTEIRQATKTYLQAYDINFDRQSIVDMHEIPKGIENQIVSQYKFTIWTYRNIAKRGNKKDRINPREIKAKLEKELKFYAEHIMYMT